MTVRTKTLVIIGLTLLSLIVILSFVSQTIMLNSFAKLEERIAEQHVGQARNAFYENINHLNVNTSDWSAWDDTYNFIGNPNNQYIEANLTYDTFQLLNLNLMLFINNSGDFVYAKAFDLNTQKTVPVPNSLREHLTAGSPLLSHTSPESSVAGFLLLPEGPLLLTSCPIVTSQKKGPIRGTLIMGYFLESKEIRHLAETTNLSLTFKRSDNNQLPQDFQTASSSLKKKESIFIQPLNSDSIAGYCFLQDIYGKPALLLRVDMPRNVYKQGWTNMVYAIFSFLVVGLIIAVINLLIMEKTVLSRLVRLSSDIRRIGSNSDLSGRVSIEGRDELSSMANEVNKMLESLEHSQQQLRESEKQHRNLFETMAQGVIYQDADGRIISANPAAQKILGLPPDLMQSPAYGNTYWKAIYEDGSDFPIEYHPSMIALTTGREVNNVIMGVYNRKESQYRWINMHAIPIFRQGDEKPYQVYTSFEDITERVYIEEKLRKHRDCLEEAVNKRTEDLTAILGQLETACATLQQEASERKMAEEKINLAFLELDQIFNAVADKMCVIGKDYNLIRANKSLAVATGIPIGKLVGKKCYEVFTGLHCHTPRCTLRRILEGETLVEYDFDQMNGDGSVSSYIVTATPIRKPDGELFGFVKNVKDISGRKQMEKEMARLDRLNLVGEMAAGIGHEVRNPMTTVRGFLQLLSKKKVFNSHEKYFKLMIEELDRANAIITEFLTLAKGKAVQLELKNLNEMINTLIPLMKADATLADKYIRFQFEEVPYLLLDEKEIRQLILNLVRNGLEAMSSGGYLTIKTYVEDNEVVLSVQDEGTGIEPDVLEKIGTPFFTTKGNGSGLGLAVCYSIASRHNATIKIETSWRGTTFFVRFNNTKFC